MSEPTLPQLLVPTPPTPEQVALLLENYLGHAEQALIDADVPASRVLVAPGVEAAWDECCAGQLWVRLVSITPWTGGATGRGGTGNLASGSLGGGCGVLWWTATVELGILRCAATVDSRGNPPSAGKITEDGRATSRDAMLLMPVVVCHPATTATTPPSWAPLGTDGGCTGGAWTFTVKIDACGCA